MRLTDPDKLLDGHQALINAYYDVWLDDVKSRAKAIWVKRRRALAQSEEKK